VATLKLQLLKVLQLQKLLLLLNKLLQLKLLLQLLILLLNQLKVLLQLLLLKLLQLLLLTNILVKSNKCISEKPSYGRVFPFLGGWDASGAHFSMNDFNLPHVQLSLNIARVPFWLCPQRYMVGRSVEWLS